MRVVREGPAKITKGAIETAWRRRAKDTRLVLGDAECRGLALVVNPGSMSWTFSYKPRGGDGRLVNWDRETKRLMEETGTAGWTRHDLRRTGATLLGEMGVEPHVIEAALNHAAIHSRLAATYNRARYLPAVREALQLLADRLYAIGAAGAEVA